MLSKNFRSDSWTLQESMLHINPLELKAISLALFTFHKVDNATTLLSTENVRDLQPVHDSHDQEKW